VRGHLRASQDQHKPAPPLTEDDIRNLITGLGDLRDVIRDAGPAVKAAIYEQLGLKVTYLPGQDKLRADVTISPETFAPKSDKYGKMGRVREGGLEPPCRGFFPIVVKSPAACSSATETGEISPSSVPEHGLDPLFR